ncbi:para-hydroxybenzoate-polyprenyltransferase [Paracoccidioides lutzii Pb01]|uniref:4-hydroxybenzoate polyprenyltransferase, mitochondrial n=1 Tax=Paracoccidioides lutzii (strain ATCC MYA-826 / Pb01) TaxID=502779 RepID=C1H9P8_PARBA|nr:para-hydroxybenzoate-polyprenyltransferase [Paracoccidioides lutzii Pb01]EEH37071.2 para-hydroxybenzoate-polyprenyltransferase [Paracoccidioides lutzii Pb01]
MRILPGRQFPIYPSSLPEFVPVFKTKSRLRCGPCHAFQPHKLQSCSSHSTGQTNQKITIDLQITKGKKTRLLTTRHISSSPRTLPSPSSLPLKPSPSSQLPNAIYTPPTTGFIALLPKSWMPYAELIRLDKPAGTYYLFFPCAFSTLLAAPLASPMATPLEVASVYGMFFVGALVMRGAGCAINDLWDRNLDPLVERTRLRPIARRAISPQNALVFTGTQLLVGLGVLLQFPSQCLSYGIPSLLLVGTYPLAKRVTNYPQFVLGLTFSWGAMMGFPALNVDVLADINTMLAASALYSSCVSWTILYDMIYAHMDVKDDAAAGIKSIALKHKHNTKAVLSALAVAQVGFLAVSGVAVNAGPIFFIGSCGSAVASLATMIWKVKLSDVGICWWWFKNGCWITGGGITLGLLGEYLAQLFGLYETADSVVEGSKSMKDL